MAIDDTKNAMMVLHCGAYWATLDELRALPDPEPMGKAHKPLHPARIAEEVKARLEVKDVSIVRERYAITPTYKRFFAVWDVSRGASPDRTGAVAIRSSINETMGLHGMGGTRLLICDNLAFQGGHLYMRKQTTGLRIATVVDELVTSALGQVDQIGSFLEAERRAQVDDAAVHRLVGQMLIDGVLDNAAVVRDAARLWFSPGDGMEDVAPRSLYGLHNAFTREIQRLHPGKQIDAAQCLGRFFGDLVHHRMPVAATKAAP